MKKNVLIELFVSFFKIGMFTIGGGLAMVPLMSHEVSEVHGWVDDEEIMDMVAISESTPGVMAINMATFTGYKIAGFVGAVVASLAVTIPSFMIILIISLFYDKFRSSHIVDLVFKGLRSGVAVLLVNATIKLAKKVKFDLTAIIITLAAFILVVFFNTNTIWIIFVCALLGILFGKFVKKKEEVK